MDPVQALADIRRASKMYRTNPTSALADQIVEQFSALDDWMASGGANPWSSERPCPHYHYQVLRKMVGRKLERFALCNSCRVTTRYFDVNGHPNWGER